MATIQIELTFNSINTSAQIGDSVYYTVPMVAAPGGFTAGELDNTYYLGEITNISGGTITIQYDDIETPLGPLAAGCLVSFVKDKKINTSSLVGYYAEVNFVNDSDGKVELFSVGSEISESSK
tara:strand:- start:306 stop:674 length:369 start_codon:yes stop_codon:yes gene_type:complete